MNQLLLLHDAKDGTECIVNTSRINYCTRNNDDTATCIYLHHMQHSHPSLIVKETPAEIVAMQWGGVCSA